VVTLPAGLIVFVCHDGAYTSSTTLAPGEGAWLKSQSVQTVFLE
jgi:hypothetical protein